MLSAAGKLVGMLTFPVTVAGHEIPIIIPTASLAEAVSACLPSTAECQRDVRSCMRHEGNAVQGTRITTCATSQPPVQLHEHTLQQLRQFKQQGSHGGLQQGLCGIVGVTLPNGHWASGIIVSKCATISRSTIQTTAKVQIYTRCTCGSLNDCTCCSLNDLELLLPANASVTA